jgi:hypothetical protein
VPLSERGTPGHVEVGQSAPHQKEHRMVTMFTIILVFLFIVLAVPLGLATQRWLCREQGEVSDPEWELYQQRYD